MEKGQEKKTEKSKITPFDITDEMLDDPELDAFLKETLMREADEIEAEINEDPSLRGVRASEDMYGAIVEELKKQGIWEEEKNLRQDQDGEKGNPQESLEELYMRLPQEDREALALGKKVYQKEREKKERRRKRNRILRRCGTAAAALAVVFGLGMTSEANRSLFLKAWEGLMYNFNFRVSTDYVPENDARSKTKDELAALQEIEERLGAPVIDLEYLPEGMEYDDYLIEDNNREAILFYTYQKQIFSVYVINVQNENSDSSMYVALTQDAVIVDTVKNEQDMEITVYETDRELDAPMYAAELEHNGFRYFLNGLDSQEEMVKTAKFILIL